MRVLAPLFALACLVALFGIIGYDLLKRRSE